MAKYEASVFGRLRGKVGGVVGQYWKGVKYVKEYTIPTDRRSQAQLNVRWCTSLISLLWSAYQTRLKNEPKSGISFFPAFQNDYDGFQRIMHKETRSVISNFPNALLGADSTQRQGKVATLLLTNDKSPTQVQLTEGFYVGQTPPRSELILDMKAFVIFYDTTTRELQILSGQNPEEIPTYVNFYWGDEDLWTGNLEFNPEHVYLYFMFIELRTRPGGVNKFYRSWGGGNKWSV